MKKKTPIQPLRLSRETRHRLGDNNLTSIDDNTGIPRTLSRLVWCAQ